MAQRSCVSPTLPMSARSATGRQPLSGSSVHSGEEKGTAGVGWGVGAGSPGASCQRIEGNRLGLAPGARLSQAAQLRM